MGNQPHPLRLNVGFIAHESVGYHRQFLVELPALHLPPDLDLQDFSFRVDISRTYQGLLARANFKALTSLECVRCLEPFHQPLEASFTELYAFSKKSVSESGLLLPDSGFIDFGPLVRECLILEIPISPLCQPDCKGLCPICGENQNQMTCDHAAANHDPQQAALQTYLTG